ncbi:kynureninase [Burkholderia stabilis]|uniref:kynureninase n=1 Tax=Burkholderia stabilis TaxID=95485 RepID=UPI00085159FE|nr:kynureninase [Burkholderia stabilis]AOR72628.1 kynureninase [Burkholderia stabilis]HDR9489446.1 kynureninase [Burkholderia stabilis]HDR9536263.1 kynureninase [Burkholderia stabilis]HDR9551777.1 kynureninase [Burkholderia stabilis]HDR9559794.1 kynureninase [Burkholderia stabilis]
MTTREHCAALDAADPLAHCRARFDLPADTIYLDGNSLGAMPANVPARMQRALEHEWAHGLIRSWNDADWYPAPQRTGDKIAALIGAGKGEVIVADSTSVNLFKVLVAATRMRPGRRVILAERTNFPTDVYIAASVAELTGCELRCVDPDEIVAAIDEDVAVVSLTHVNYKSGKRYDMAAVTRQAHEAGALSVWDLCHSAGAMPIGLNACDADFAVGCGYKYLNGGPGAPAYVFVASRHLADVRQPLTGWHGHAKPFDFTHDYAPHPAIDRMLTGTAPQLGVIALEAALDAFDGVDLGVLRDKSVALGDLFIALVDQELDGLGFTLASPRDAAQRGSQVSLAHAQGYAIVQALIARNMIGDFRAPDILRFGFAPLYVRYVDVWDTIAALKDVVATGAWNTDAFLARKSVT